ncbi:MAG: glycosyltransferase family 39 protein [Acidobacteriota bacterium]
MVDRSEGLSHDDGLFRPTRSRFIIFSLIVSAFIAFRLWGLTSYGLIGDEVFTFQLATDGWAGLIQSAVGDVVHPPLFYALLKIWIAAGGHSLLWIKLFPVAMSLCSIPPFIFLCRELGLKSEAAKLALWLMAVNDFLINFSQELRMYSQAIFFALLSLWLFARLYNSNRFSRPLAVGLFFANLLLIYTHYYGWFIPALEFLFLLLKRDERIRSFLISLMLLLLCFSPWVYFVSQASMAKGGLSANLDWNNPPTAIDLVWYYTILHGPVTYRLAAPWKSLAAVMVSAVFIYPLLSMIWRKARNLELTSRLSQDALPWLALFSFLPPLLSFTLSHLLKNSVWGIRYLIIAAPTYLILVALAAVKLRSPLIRKITITLIILWAGVSGLVLTLRKDKIAVAPMAARLIESESIQSTPVRVYANRAIIGYTLQFYLDAQAPQQFEVVYTDDYAAIKDAHFWVAFIKYRYEEQILPQEQIDSENYLRGEGITTETFTQKVFLFPVSQKKAL